VPSSSVVYKHISFIKLFSVKSVRLTVAMVTSMKLLYVEPVSTKMGDRTRIHRVGI